MTHTPAALNAAEWDPGHDVPVHPLPSSVATEYLCLSYSKLVYFYSQITPVILREPSPTFSYQKDLKGLQRKIRKIQKNFIKLVATEQ